MGAARARRRRAHFGLRRREEAGVHAQVGESRHAGGLLAGVHPGEPEGEERIRVPGLRGKRDRSQHSRDHRSRQTENSCQYVF